MTNWAVVEVVRLPDTVTAHREMELHVQEALGLEGLGMCSVHIDYAKRRAWLLCPRGAALRLMKVLSANCLQAVVVSFLMREVLLVRRLDCLFCMTMLSFQLMIMIMIMVNQ